MSSLTNIWNKSLSPNGLTPCDMIKRVDESVKLQDIELFRVFMNELMQFKSSFKGDGDIHERVVKELYRIVETYVYFGDIHVFRMLYILIHMYDTKKDANIVFTIGDILMGAKRSDLTCNIVKWFTDKNTTMMYSHVYKHRHAEHTVQHDKDTTEDQLLKQIRTCILKRDLNVFSHLYYLCTYKRISLSWLWKNVVKSSKYENENEYEHVTTPLFDRVLKKKYEYYKKTRNISYLVNAVLMIMYTDECSDLSSLSLLEEYISEKDIISLQKDSVHILPKTYEDPVLEEEMKAIYITQRHEITNSWNYSPDIIRFKTFLFAKKGIRYNDITNWEVSKNPKNMLHIHTNTEHVTALLIQPMFKIHEYLTINMIHFVFKTRHIPFQILVHNIVYREKELKESVVTPMFGVYIPFISQRHRLRFTDYLVQYTTSIYFSETIKQYFKLLFGYHVFQMKHPKMSDIHVIINKYNHQLFHEDIEIGGKSSSTHMFHKTDIELIRMYRKEFDESFHETTKRMTRIEYSIEFEMGFRNSKIKTLLKRLSCLQMYIEREFNEDLSFSIDNSNSNSNPNPEPVVIDHNWRKRQRCENDDIDNEDETVIFRNLINKN